MVQWQLKADRQANMSPTLDPFPSSPVARAWLSLEGLSTGDALGERYFGPSGAVIDRMARREVPPSPWRYTDDTEMALSIFEVLAADGGIEGDRLALAFARRFDPKRGYGQGARQLLEAIRMGCAWREVAPALFGGSGSFGNGAAMRVTPLGAYFADDLPLAARQAALSSEVTHSHAEGIAGGIAVAIAAASAWRQSEDGDLSSARFFSTVLEFTPPSETRERLVQVANLPANTPSEEIAERVGSGQKVSAQDTVPFALSCAAHHLASFEETFWATVRGLGDRDTTCAIACGVVALSARRIPERWLAAREPLPVRMDFE
jgi:ADP-ribosylglycohydrolase